MTCAYLDIFKYVKIMIVMKSYLYSIYLTSNQKWVLDTPRMLTQRKGGAVWEVLLTLGILRFYNSMAKF